eukprot:SAG11_NODE_1176_length_5600_cov_8.953827_6_plen_192_part_00
MVVDAWAVQRQPGGDSVRLGQVIDVENGGRAVRIKFADDGSESGYLALEALAPAAAAQVEEGYALLAAAAECSDPARKAAESAEAAEDARERRVRVSLPLVVLPTVNSASKSRCLWQAWMVHHERLTQVTHGPDSSGRVRVHYADDGTTAENVAAEELQPASAAQLVALLGEGAWVVHGGRLGRITFAQPK